MKKPPRSSAALCSSSLTSLQKPEVFPGLFETTGADGKVPIQFAGVCMTGIFNSFQLLHTGSVGKLAVKMLHDEFGNLTIVAIISGIGHHILLCRHRLTTFVEFLRCALALRSCTCSHREQAAPRSRVLLQCAPWQTCPQALSAQNRFRPSQ